jgi:hypothetical protein
LAKRGLHCTVVLALALMSAASRPLLAQGTPAAQPTAAELSTARQLFSEGLKAEDKSKWLEALALFERVKAIVVSPAVYYHVAVCHEQLGHMVEALNAFELAIQEAERKRDTAALEEARDHVTKLRPKIANLTINLPADAEEAQITLDDRPINAALAGTSMLIDPGQRHLVVTAGNYERPFDTMLTARPGESAAVTVDLGGKKAVPPPPVPPPPPSVTSPPPVPPPSASSPPPPVSRGPIFLAGGATVALGAGALIAGVVAHNQYTSFQEKNERPAPGSYAERKALRDSGEALAVTSTVLTFAALIGGGVTAYFLLRRPANQPSALMWSPWVGGASAGVSLGGVL